MREIIKVERKRILSSRRVIMILMIVLVSSIFSMVKLLKDYNIYDSNGNLEISSKENLRKSREKEKVVLDEKIIKDVVNRTDKSKYLYNSNLTRLVSLNYPDKKLEDITDEEIEKFYLLRIKNLEDILKNPTVEHTKEELKYVIKSVDNLKMPLKIGYAQGWKILNNEMVDFITIILIIISVLVTPVFAEDSKTKMRELYIVAKHGKKSLIKYRIIAGIQVGTILYTLSIIVFSVIRLLVFGVEGYNLPIQNSIKYFFSMYNITYLEQFLINLLLGFIAMLVLTALIYFFSVMVKQILPSAVLVVFTWIIMVTIPIISFDMQHYFANFLPYSMINFNNYYKLNETYIVLGKVMPSILWVSIVGIMIFLAFIISTIFIENKKLNQGIEA